MCCVRLISISIETCEKKATKTIKRQKGIELLCLYLFDWQLTVLVSETEATADARTKGEIFTWDSDADARRLYGAGQSTPKRQLFDSLPHEFIWQRKD